jgi:hypothetical protein
VVGDAVLRICQKSEKGDMCNQNDTTSKSSNETAEPPGETIGETQPPIQGQNPEKIGDVSGRPNDSLEGCNESKEQPTIQSTGCTDPDC